MVAFTDRNGRIVIDKSYYKPLFFVETFLIPEKIDFEHVKAARLFRLMKRYCPQEIRYIH